MVLFVFVVGNDDLFLILIVLLLFDSLYVDVPCIVCWLVVLWLFCCSCVDVGFGLIVCYCCGWLLVCVLCW